MSYESVLYCNTDLIQAAWSVQAEAPCAGLLFGESQGLLLCLSLLLKGVKSLWAESIRLMSRFNDVPRPCGKASRCPAEQLKLSHKIISEREPWLNII